MNISSTKSPWWCRNLYHRKALLRWVNDEVGWQSINLLPFYVTMCDIHSDPMHTVVFQINIRTGPGSWVSLRWGSMEVKIYGWALAIFCSWRSSYWWRGGGGLGWNICHLFLWTTIYSHIQPRSVIMWFLITSLVPGWDRAFIPCYSRLNMNMWL